MSNNKKRISLEITDKNIKKNNIVYVVKEPLSWVLRKTSACGNVGQSEVEWVVGGRLNMLEDF